ncbi:MAG: ABC transporter substrate-binding protein [Lachnospiraceae bacterium]|nr:ABC transporter substrate-binding protein [Lachnospiraceae bacterium]
MSHWFRNYWIKAAFVASAAALAGLGTVPSFAENTEEATEITLCLDWTPNTNHTGFYVADALGYYEEAGLEVTIVQPPENGAPLMCASGQAQFAIDAQDTIAAAFDMDEPLEVTAVAAMITHNTSGIISRAGDGIETPKGLEGKIYSTWESPIELSMLQYVMEQDGGDYSKVKLIPNDITDEPAALAAHQTDAVWIFYGWSGINAQVEGVETDYWAFGDLSEELDYYTPIIIANNDFLQENPETAKAFLAATAKGYAYAIENPREAADMLIAGDSTGSLAEAEELVYASQEWLAGKYIDDAPAWGYIDPQRWDAFYGWLYQNGLTTNDLTGMGYSNDYLPE